MSDWGDCETERVMGTHQALRLDGEEVEKKMNPWMSENMETGRPAATSEVLQRCLVRNQQQNVFIQ